MKIVDALFVESRSGFFNEDFEAIKAGASRDGFAYRGAPLSPGFAMWKQFAGQFQDLPVAGLVAMSSPGALTALDVAAYAAPFPDERYQAGVRRFPQLVPVEPGMEGVRYCEEARSWLTSEWSGETFMAVGLRGREWRQLGA